MKFSKLTLAIAATLSVSASFSAVAMDLYVDTKTKQIFAEPGRGRELMGSFQKVDEAPATTVAPAAPAAEITAMKQDLDLKTNEIKALQEHAAEASGPESVHVKLSDGIHFATKDGNFTAGINGRMQVDSQSNVNQQLQSSFLNNTGISNQLNDGATLRRARLGVEGTFFKDYGYKFEYDFTRGANAAGGITDAYISYAFSKPFNVRFGAFKEPFSMEEATSNRYTTFIERNKATNAFVDNLNTYKVGAGAFYAQDRWQAATSFQTEGIGQYSNAYGTGATQSNFNGPSRSGGSGDTSWEVNARVTGLPWMESKTKFLHVGTSGSYININNNYTGNNTLSNGGLIFASTVNSNVDRTAILNTGNLTSDTKGAASSLQANHVFRFGAESALVYGPFSAQAEYIQVDVSGNGYNSNNNLSGYYGYMTYFLTGESRNYKSKTGAWDRIKPNHNFDMKGGWGAWELAAGYDAIDLNSKAIQGGKASTVKFGLNWYPISHVRVMTDYVHILDINTQNAQSPSVNGNSGTVNTVAQGWNNGQLDMIESRIQLDW